MRDNKMAAPTGIEGGHNHDTSKSNATDLAGALKYQRVLRRLLGGPLHRFEAEKFPVSDHCLPTTISELKKRGIIIQSRMIRLPGFAGLGAHVAEYQLAEESRERARLLAGRPQ